MNEPNYYNYYGEGPSSGSGCLMGGFVLLCIGSLVVCFIADLLYHIL